MGKVQMDLCGKYIKSARNHPIGQNINGFRQELLYSVLKIISMGKVQMAEGQSEGNNFNGQITNGGGTKCAKYNWLYNAK